MKLWYVVVATAPCTLRAATVRAELQPWRKTLLHFTIAEILPMSGKGSAYDERSRFWNLVRNRGFAEEESRTWKCERMVAVLERCREKQAIDLVRTNEGLKVVDTFLTETARHCGRVVTCHRISMEICSQTSRLQKP